MTFGEKIKKLRTDKSLTQDELAEKLYVTRTAISKWESDKGYPNIDSLKQIAKFFSVTIDELLSSGELLTIAEQENKKKEKYYRDLKALTGRFNMDSILKTKKINSPFGILFQIPVFLLSAFGLLQLAYMFWLSLTDFNGMTRPKFIWFQNYAEIFKDELVLKSFGNTAIMVLAVTLLLFVTAVLPALFISKLKMRFGIIVLSAFSVISIFSRLPSFFNTLGFKIFLENSVNGLIPVTHSHARLVAIIIMWFYCLAPVFAITYIMAKLKHSFVGVALSVCSIPVLMCFGSGIQTETIGYPSANSSADWLYMVFKDYQNVRFAYGFSYAVLFMGLAILALWCALVFFVTFGFRRILTRVKTESSGIKMAGYTAFSLSLVFFLIVSFFFINYLSSAVTSIAEFYQYPYTFITRDPTLQNFTDLFNLPNGYIPPFSRYLYNSFVAVPLMIMPVCLFVALPSGAGFSLFKSFKKEKLLLLCFIPFLFLGGLVLLIRFGIADNYLAYTVEFLSSVEFFVALFLVWLTLKLVFSGGKTTVDRILLGVFSLLTSFYAIGAIRGILYASNTIYSEELKTWRCFGLYVLRVGVSNANGVLMLLAILAVLIAPIILFICLYLSYRKSTINTLEA